MRRPSSSTLLALLLLAPPLGAAELGASDRAGPAQPDPGDEPATAELSRLPKLRRVELGFELGQQAIPARNGAADYAAGLALVGSARAELRPWLGLRFLARHSRHAVALVPGGLAAADATPDLRGAALEQPALEAWLLGVRLEPTWVMTPRLRLWLGLGAGWLRAEAPPIEGELAACTPRQLGTLLVSCQLHAAERTALASELGLTLGTTVDLIPRWLTLNLSTGLSAIIEPSGSLFGSQQVLASGSRHWLSGLPPFGASSTILVGLGLVL